MHWIEEKVIFKNIKLRSHWFKCSAELENLFRMNEFWNCLMNEEEVSQNSEEDL
jgi:CRISPR/Cas system-associated protein Csm6